MRTMVRKQLGCCNSVFLPMRVIVLCALVVVSSALAKRFQNQLGPGTHRIAIADLVVVRPPLARVAAAAIYMDKLPKSPGFTMMAGCVRREGLLHIYFSFSTLTHLTIPLTHACRGHME
jgi:hypothetical protein